MTANVNEILSLHPFFGLYLKAKTVIWRCMLCLYVSTMKFDTKMQLGVTFKSSEVTKYQRNYS
jgi:hypothetical protein